MSTPTHRFWSDDFDMDLLRVMPDVVQMLGDDGARSAWTVGSETHGRLNHPTVWNSHGAFVWRTKPNLPRDEHGWFNIEGCVDNKPEIECSWLELLRDAWPHHYAAVLLPDGQRLPAAPQNAFDRIMWTRRGWKKYDTAADIVATVDWIMAWHEALAKGGPR